MKLWDKHEFFGTNMSFLGLTGIIWDQHEFSGTNMKTVGQLTWKLLAFGLTLKLWTNMITEELT